MLLRKKNLILSNSSRSISYLNELKKNNIELNYVIFYGFTKIKQLSNLSKIHKKKFFKEKKLSKNIIKFIYKTKLKQFVISPNKSEIIKDKILLKKLKILHLHPGKLPEFKGSTTLYYSKLANKKTVCTCFRMMPLLDTGDILFQQNFKNSSIYEKNIDKYDDYIRGVTLVNFFKTNKTKIMRNDKKNKYSPYYIIHPVLRKIALNKKFKSRLNKVIKSYT